MEPTPTQLQASRLSCLPGHDRARGHPLEQRVAVLAVGADHRVARPQRLHPAHRHRLLADVEVQEPADLLLLVELGRLLLQPADPQHLGVEVQAVLARREVFVAHP
jgi:hypothetical protein